MALRCSAKFRPDIQLYIIRLMRKKEKKRMTKCRKNWIINTSSSRRHMSRSFANSFCARLTIFSRFIFTFSQGIPVTVYCTSLLQSWEEGGSHKRHINNKSNWKQHILTLNPQSVSICTVTRVAL